jgi:hypothetical protein
MKKLELLNYRFDVVDRFEVFKLCLLLNLGIDQSSVFSYRTQI